MPSQGQLFNANDDACLYCGKPATRLCDFVLGLTKEERHDDQKLFTCDAPMCDDCTAQVGMSFICVRGGKGRGCHHETHDHCRAHVGQIENPKWPMTESEAEAERCRLRFALIYTEPGADPAAVRPCRREHSRIDGEPGQRAVAAVGRGSMPPDAS